MAEPRLTGVLRQIRKLFTAQEHDALSDRELLNRFITDRDEAAVTALIERHGSMILGICRRVLGRDHDAEDACQAAFLVLIRKAASVRKKESLASWLHGVAYHVATSLKRNLARRRSREGAVAKAPQQSTTEDWTWREVQAVIDQELARLPDRFRAPLVLCYLEGKTRDEAARQLRWTLGTVRGRLERGRELLRARLTRRGLAFSAALAACNLGTGPASAAMSPTLAISTINAMMSTGIGNAAAVGAVPANVAALSEGMVKAMFSKKLRIATILLLAIAGSGMGLALAMRGSPRAYASAVVEELSPQEWRGPDADAGPNPAQVRVWDVATGKERRTGLEGAWDDQEAWNDRHITLTPDGRTIAVRGLGGPKYLSHNHSGGNVVLRETAGGGRRIELTGHTDDVMDVAFSPDGRTLASASMDKTVRLWDLPSGKEIGRLEGHRHWVLSIAFSPDGGTLVSGGLDKTALVWDVSNITRRRGKFAERSSAELEADWKDLAGDSAAGYAALGRLVSSPERAVASLGKQLQSAESTDTKRIERLIADLDDEQFEVREQATRELEALAERVAPALRKALAGKPSPEAKRRLGALLDRLDGARPAPETVRQIRAVEALESIGSPEARRLLDKLAAGPSETLLTQEAKTAAGRLAKRTSVAP